jgi:hypothetical protein
VPEPEAAPGARSHDELIAVIGIGCRFPGGADTTEHASRHLGHGPADQGSHV